jgi:hypothetical protein
MLCIIWPVFNLSSGYLLLDPTAVLGNPEAIAELMTLGFLKPNETASCNGSSSVLYATTVCPFADNCVGVPYITSRLVRKHTCVKGIMMYDKRGAVDFFRLFCR